MAKPQPPRMRVSYRRTDPYGTERSPFEVVATGSVRIDDTMFYECATGKHAACERTSVAPIAVCACRCHEVG